MGSQRFAADTEQHLTSFYSVDTLCQEKSRENSNKKVKNIKILCPSTLSTVQTSKRNFMESTQFISNSTNWWSIGLMYGYACNY